MNEQQKRELWMEILSDWGLINRHFDWMDDAACNGMDGTLFFPDRGENNKLASAKAICARCLVKDECLDFALDNDIYHGVWGGMSGVERQRIRVRWRKENKK